jgi:serine/threonine protein kinase
MKSIYELNADPEQGLDELIGTFGRNGEAALLEEAEKLLADVSVQPDLMARIDAVFCLPRASTYPAIRGPLGACIFLDLVTRASLHEVPAVDLRTSAQALLLDDMVRDSLRFVYRLDESHELAECDLSQVDLHEIGTTSVILDCCRSTPPNERVALKCVLPRHFGVRAITDAALHYGQRYGAVLSVAPKVYGSNERAVVMEFVAGRTLAERFAEDHVPEQPDDPKGKKRAELRALGSAHIAFIRELGHKLCDVLAQLSVDGQCHLDLSPRNIILMHEDPLDIRLIDFGRNFAIAEGVASSLALARASVYVEPQMITRQRVGDWRSDCYSLGIILLEAAARQQLNRDSINQELWRLWTGEYLWDGAPGLARIVEDLIDAEPDQRLAFIERSSDIAPLVPPPLTVA